MGHTWSSNTDISGRFQIQIQGVHSLSFLEHLTKNTSIKSLTVHAADLDASRKFTLPPGLETLVLTIPTGDLTEEHIKSLSARSLKKLKIKNIEVNKFPINGNAALPPNMKDVVIRFDSGFDSKNGDCGDPINRGQN